MSRKSLLWRNLLQMGQQWEVALVSQNSSLHPASQCWLSVLSARQPVEAGGSRGQEVPVCCRSWQSRPVCAVCGRLDLGFHPLLCVRDSMRPCEGQERALPVGQVCTDALPGVPFQPSVSLLLLAVQFRCERCQAAAVFGPRVPSWGFGF